MKEVGENTIWSKLPREVLESLSLEVFRKRIMSHWIMFISGRGAVGWMARWSWSLPDKMAWWFYECKKIWWESASQTDSQLQIHVAVWISLLDSEVHIGSPHSGWTEKQIYMIKLLENKAVRWNKSRQNIVQFETNKLIGKLIICTKCTYGEIRHLLS